MLAHPSVPCPARAAGGLAMALLLAGCATLAPRYETPALPVAPAYPADGGPDAGAASTTWRATFADPLLLDLIAQSLDHNRDLRAAVLHVEEARAAYGIQRAGQFPTLAAQGSLDRLRIPPIAGLTGTAQTVSAYQVGLGMASWEIDFWGRVRSLKEAALETYLATEAAQRAATVGLIAQVANSYLGICELDERIALARETLASRAETLRIFTRRVEVGSTSRFDLTQVQTLWSQAQILEAQLEQARAAEMNALTMLVGTPIELPAEPHPLDEQHMVVDLRAGLPSDLLSNRPDILAAEHQLKAAHANIGAARAAFFPRIALTGSIGTVSNDLDGLFAAGSQMWRFSPSLSLPLFDGGQRRNNMCLAEVRRDLAVASYEKTVQGAFREVANALSARRWMAEQVATATAALAVQHERARLARLRYDNGAAAFLEVLDAQRELLSAEQQLVQLRRGLVSSRVTLYAALGGGPSDQPAPAPSRGTP